MDKGKLESMSVDQAIKVALRYQEDTEWDFWDWFNSNDFEDEDSTPEEI